MMLGEAAPMAEAAAPAGATFRSLRGDRGAEPAPTAEPTPAAETPAAEPVAEAPVAEAAVEAPAAEPVAEIAETVENVADASVPPTSLTDDIKRILNEERDYSAPAEPIVEQPAPAAPEEAPIAAEPAAQVEAEELSLGEAPRMFEAEPIPQTPVEDLAPVEPAPVAPAQTFEQEISPAPAAEVETLSQARSLREVLDAEAAAPAETLEESVQTVQEPTLQDLGLRRPQTPPVQEAETLAEAIPEVPAETQEARAREAFTNIDDLNTKLDAQTAEQSDLDAAGLDLGGASAGSDTSFSTGFAVAVILAVTGALLYLMGPRIGASVPAVADIADSYNQTVDGGRMVIQELYYGGEGEPGFGNFFSNLMGIFS